MIEMQNSITAVGRILDEPKKTNKDTYRSRISVSRLSGFSDTLLLECTEDMLAAVNAAGSSCVRVVGQIRTHNAKSGGKSHLIIKLFAQSIEPCEPDTTNDVRLTGFVCKKPVYRVTPFGREISDLMLAVNRSDGKSDYIPCIVWGSTAKWAEKHIEIGDAVSLCGRFQSRDYSKTLESGDSVIKTAYEVSAAKIAKEDKSPWPETCMQATAMHAEPTSRPDTGISSCGADSTRDGESSASNAPAGEPSQTTIPA